MNLSPDQHRLASVLRQRFGRVCTNKTLISRLTDSEILQMAAVNYDTAKNRSLVEFKNLSLDVAVAVRKTDKVI